MCPGYRKHSRYRKHSPTKQSQHANVAYRNIVESKMLRAFGHHVAMCCNMLGVVGLNSWKWSNLSQQPGIPHVATCCNRVAKWTQQIADFMLCVCSASSKYNKNNSVPLLFLQYFDVTYSLLLNKRMVTQQTTLLSAKIFTRLFALRRSRAWLKCEHACRLTIDLHLQI